MPFQLESNFKPRGDQGQAVAKLLKSVEAGNRHQTLLGVTGSGKTFTVANVIQQLKAENIAQLASISFYKAAACLLLGAFMLGAVLFFHFIAR